MKNMKMRLFSVVLSLCMIIAMMPISVAADDAVGEVTVATAEDFESALAGEATIIKLEDNIEFGEKGFFVKDGVTIDGGNHTITLSNVYHGGANAAFYSTGSYTVQNLTITLAESATNIHSSAIDMRNGGNVTNVTINGKFQNGVIVNHSDVTVSGCTFDTNNGTNDT